MTVGMKVGVVSFPGSLDDRDAVRAVRLAGGSAVALWHGDHDLQGVDAVIIPGGFSYGDYLRAGAISRFAPLMEQITAAASGGAQALADPESADIGEHQVEHDRRVLGLLREPQGVRAGGGRVDREALGLEPGLESAQQVDLVIDDQDADGVLRARPATQRGSGQATAAALKPG